MTSEKQTKWHTASLYGSCPYSMLLAALVDRMLDRIRFSSGLSASAHFALVQTCSFEVCLPLTICIKSRLCRLKSRHFVIVCLCET